MAFKIYTTDEIFIILAGVKTITDVQRIGNYIHEHRDNYSLFDNILFERSLLIYLEVFI